MSVDKFFDSEIKAIAVSSNAIARQAARKLQEEILSEIRRNFHNATAAFRSGVKVYDFENASVVTLSPLLSSFAQPQKIQGSPNLWILLPEGAKLGFRRLGNGFGWSDLKRRYGKRLSFVPVSDGHVVLFRTNRGQVKPIYKIQSAVNREQKIDWHGAINKVAQEFELDVMEAGDGIND